MSNTHLPFGLSKNAATLILLGAAVLFFVILKATKPDAQVQSDVEPTYTVRTVEVTPSPLSPALTLYGTVVAPGRASLSAAISANVAAVHRQAGDSAKEGEVLIELDAAEAEIALTQARASLQQAEAQLSLDRSQRANNRDALAQERQLLSLAEKAVARALRLRTQGVLSDADVDASKQKLQQQKLSLSQRELAVQQADARSLQLRAELSSAEARMQRAELDLQRTQIRAPFDAAVIATHVAVGNRVNVGNPLIELYDTSRVEIQAQIPNRYLPSLRRALRDNVRVAAHAYSQGQEYPARFIRLASSGAAGGQDGYFQLLNTDLPVDSKLSLKLELPPEDDAIALPYDAVYDLSRIFKLSDGRLQSMEIEKLGDYVPPDSSDRTQYLLVRARQLKAGDQVLISQLPNAVTGLKVQAIQK